MRTALSFDDVWLVPQYSEIDSRADVTLETKIGNIKLDVPFISANMDTITEVEMATAMASCGGAGILHRFTDLVTVEKWVTQIKAANYPAIISIGVDSFEELEFVNTLSQHGLIDGVCIDVAHIDTRKGLSRVEEVAKICHNAGKITVIAGNIATAKAANRLRDCGADVVKTSIAGGAVCRTRDVTGHMYPTLQAVMDIVAVAGSNIDIIADGGIRNGADIAKCLAAGAKAVMLGSMLAGSAETPGHVYRGDDGLYYKVYRGSASRESQMARNPTKRPRVEGVSKNIPLKGSVIQIINDLSDGLRSAFSYSGALNLTRFQLHADFICVK